VRIINRKAGAPENTAEVGVVLKFWIQKAVSTTDQTLRTVAGVMAHAGEISNMTLKKPNGSRQGLLGKQDNCAKLKARKQTRSKT